MKYRLLAIAVLIVTFPLPVTAQTHRYARVISENANLRDMPNVTSTSILEVPEETLVKILDEKLPWYVVRIGNRVGWMHGDTLEFVITSTPAPRLSEQTITPDYTPKPLPPSGGYTPRSNDANPHYIRGPRGGCYYISSSGRKVYVDRSMCN
ncbi:MAG TPA: SH3 domain-containing protein [Pyrinomonadaceae bacterium]|nr:SH3 domain-containing protein [Pyrinomonadaceae bacterium]